MSEPFTTLTTEWAKKVDALARVLHREYTWHGRWQSVSSSGRERWRIIAATAIRECQGVDAVEATRAHDWS